jgi:hypothetical protein
MARVLHFFAATGAPSPLWAFVEEGGPPGMVELSTLALSPDLASELAAWADRIWTYDEDDEEWRACWDRDGRALHKRTRSELAPTIDVVWDGPLPPWVLRPEG